MIAILMGAGLLLLYGIYAFDLVVDYLFDWEQE